MAMEAEARQEKRRWLLGRVATLEETSGQAFTFQQAVDAIAAGLARALNLELIRGEVSAGERALARELRQNRYAGHEWTAGT
jgi:lipoate-protein ligase A